MDERTIKESIKRNREKLGYTQEEMAEELGFSEASSYWRFEDGKTRIINLKLYRFAEVCGKSVEEILLGRSITDMLKDEPQMEQEINALKEYYEQKLSEKDETISNLNDYIKNLKKNE